KNDLDTKLWTLWRDHVKVLLDNPEILPFFNDKRMEPDLNDRLENIAGPEKDKTRNMVITFVDLRLETIDQILSSIDQWSSAEVLTWKSTFIDQFYRSI